MDQSDVIQKFEGTEGSQRSQTPLVFLHASDVHGCKLLKANGAEGGTRTLTALRPTNFKPRFLGTDLMLLRMTKQYLPAFQPSKQVR